MTEGRVVARAEAARRADEWRAAGQRVALAVGGFDLLSSEQVRFLRESRARADRLVVAVRAPVPAAAGAPPMPAALEPGERARIVAALRGVDLVIVSEEPSPEALARELGASDCRESPASAERATRSRILASLRSRA